MVAALLGLASPALADSIELEIGGGFNLYDPGLSRILMEDQSVRESISPYSYSFPGPSRAHAGTNGSAFAQLDMYSNDFLFTFYWREHTPNVRGNYWASSSSFVDHGIYDFDVLDRIFAVGFSHMLYAMQDRMRITVGYGFLDYSEDVNYRGTKYNRDHSASPATLQNQRDAAYLGKSGGSAAYLGLGLEYDWSKSIRIKSQLRLAPSATGSYSLHTTLTGFQATEGSSNPPSVILGTTDRGAPVRYDILFWDLKLQYALHDHIQLNMGFNYEYIRSRYSAEPDYSLYVVQDFTAETSQIVNRIEVEPFSDPSIYYPRNRHLGTFYFSITFRSGRTNL